ncbi:ribonuclease H family protein [Williamsoniiplasma luminosum]|uniref:ribonuclease H n=1 Tax=Williamsoniiplasma luminosum TaxID=214888 RepID=A0A2S0NK50_9MOLU|nr:ribonuclease H family protein [Williamsoniiplasma luminosum]AVP49388.1 MAG: RNase H [Williamsoniiplasma luminosum]
MGKKFYAVKAGRKTGVFEDWDEVQNYISGYKNAVFKSFKTPQEAWDFMKNKPLMTPEKPIISKNFEIIENADCALAYTDGSFDPLTNTYSYGTVILWKDKVIKMSQRFDNQIIVALRNVAGELEGAKRAMKFAQSNKIKELIIHHDYIGVAKWSLGQWKANLPYTQEYVAFAQQIQKDVKLNFVWVKGHSGDHYNELADQLAGQATLKEYRKVN